MKELATLALAITIIMSESISQASALVIGRGTSPLLIIGLNPALQKRFILSNKNPDLISGNVHRASEVQEGIGGKGQDVAVAMSCLSRENNYDNDVYLAQFLGSGAEGDLALSKLNDIASPMVRTSECTIRTEARLRTCTTIIGDHGATELVEPSGQILVEEIQQLKESLTTLATTSIQTSSPMGGLCIMGSMPPGCHESLYAEIFSTIVNVNGYVNPETRTNLVCVIDTVAGLPNLLESMKQNRYNYNDANHGQGGNHMLKINLAELCKLSDVSLSSASEESNTASLEEIRLILQNFYAQHPSAGEALDYIAITNGKHPCHLVSVSNDKVIQLNVPDLSAILPSGEDKLYPIGAGDAVASACLAAWNYLHNDDKEPEDDTIMNPLERLDGKIQRAFSPGAVLARNTGPKEDRNDNFEKAIVSLAFGLACGTASCLQEENSVFNINDALVLFQQVQVQVLSDASAFVAAEKMVQFG